MSAFGEEISNVGGSDRHGCQGGDSNDDEDVGGDTARSGEGKKKNTNSGFRKDVGMAKQVVLQQFSKAKKQLHNRRHRRALRPSSGSAPAIASRASEQRSIYLVSMEGDAVTFSKASGGQDVSNPQQMSCFAAVARGPALKKMDVTKATTTCCFELL